MKFSRVLTIIGLLFFVSCEDDIINEDITKSSTIDKSDFAISKEDAEKYFIKTLNGLNPGSSMDGKTWIPIWSRSYTYLSDSSFILETPLFYVGKNSGRGNDKSLILSKDKATETIKAFVKEIIPDNKQENYEKQSFTGVIIYHDWGGGPLVGHRYTNGEIVSSIVNMSVSFSNGRQATGGECTEGEVITDCTHTYTYLASDPGGTWRYNGTECEEIVVTYVCNGVIPTPSSGSALSPGLPVSGGAGAQYNGSWFFPYGFDFINVRDCVKKILADLYVATKLKDGAINALLSILEAGGEVVDIYGFIQEVYDPNSPLVIELNESSSLRSDQAAVTYTTLRTVGNSRVVSVFLNSNYLNSATDLGIARTILHESIHAMMIFGEGLALSNSSAFKDLNPLLFKPNGQTNYTGSANAAHHEQMASAYIDEMASILRQYVGDQNISIPLNTNGVNSVEQYLGNLAYGGLQKTDAYKMLNNKTRRKADRIISQEADRTKTKGSRTYTCK